jgi:hypothetical protein
MIVDAVKGRTLYGGIRSAGGERVPSCAEYWHRHPRSAFLKPSPEYLRSRSNQTCTASRCLAATEEGLLASPTPKITAQPQNEERGSEHSRVIH